VCNQENIYNFCGFEGNAACIKASYECRGWLKNMDGYCVNPFKTKSRSDLEICPKAEPGYASEDYRDQ